MLEAFFYSYIGETFWPEAYDEGKWSAIREASQYKYLEEGDGTFEPNEQNRKVAGAAKALAALKSFLETEASSEFAESFSDDHDYDADFTDRAFWEGQIGL